MPSFPWITDNPFRLLKLPADTPYPELRRQAAAAIRAQSVGLGPEVDAQEIFGAEELPNVQSLVRGVAEDPLRMTRYRLYWSGESDASSASDHTSSGSQLARLGSCWRDFLISGKWQALQEALSLLQVSPECPGLREELSTLLTRDGFEFRQASSAVEAALEEACGQIPSLALTRAHLLVERGEFPDVVRILQLIAQCPTVRFDRTQVEKLLSSWARPLASQIAVKAQSCAFWRPENGVQPPPELIRLQQLIEACRTADIGTGWRDWQSKITHYLDCLGRGMREYALKLGDQSQYPEACSILEQAQQLELSGQIAYLVEHDLRRYRTLARLEAEQQLREAQESAAREASQSAAAHRDAAGVKAEPARPRSGTRAAWPVFETPETGLPRTRQAQRDKKPRLLRPLPDRSVRWHRYAWQVWALLTATVLGCGVGLYLRSTAPKRRPSVRPEARLSRTGSGGSRLPAGTSTLRSR